MTFLKPFSIILFVFLATIFYLNIHFNVGLLALLYIFPVLLSTISNEKIVLGSTIFSLISIIIGICLPESDNKTAYFFRQMLDYDEVFNILSFIMVGAISLISVKQKQKEIELNKLNEDLEMKVLVRTAASEYRAEKLEQQIEVLQLLRQANVNTSIAKLDDVITELKNLTLPEEE